jgi:protein phosphatase
LFCKRDEKLLKPTQYRIVDVDNSESIKSVEKWWGTLTEAGGEGCVIKSFDFIARKEGRLLQPMLKCRGREYLRIIYGPTYLDAKNLPLLRKRSIAWKRKLALTEFSLGIEALQRFVRRAPLWQIHECVFAILALESEPVDPRL